MYILEEMGKIESTAVIMYECKDSEGGEVWLWVVVVRKREVTNATYMWERQREIKIESKVLSLTDC